MAPPKKSKKAKRESKKSKKCKSMSVVPIEPRATESDWWDSFWQKNSPIPVFSATKWRDECNPFKNASVMKIFYTVSDYLNLISYNSNLI
ncbi:unnamed protein product, partial [Vitis vinifera]